MRCKGASLRADGKKSMKKSPRRGFFGVSAGARTRTEGVGGLYGIQFHHGHIEYQVVKAAGILRAKKRCRFFGLCSALVRRLRRRRPLWYPIPPRAHRISSCKSGGDTSRKRALPLFRAFVCARATPSASGAPTTFSVGGLYGIQFHHGHSFTTIILYHNFGKNALYFAADMV